MFTKSEHSVANLATHIFRLPPALLLTACQASGTLNLKASSSVDANATVQVSASASPEPKTPSKPAIKLVNGQLDYEGTIEFEYNKADVKSDSTSQEILGRFKDFLDAHPDVHVQIEGHTDSRGSREYNQRLSERRAEAVVGWLSTKGIAKERLAFVGKGEDDPRVPEPLECKDKTPADTKPCEAAWQENRRVRFVVTKGADALTKTEPAPPTPPPLEQPKESAPIERTTRPCKARVLQGFGAEAAIATTENFAVYYAVQPVCWFEFDVGLALVHAEASAQDLFGTRGATVPIWGVGALAKGRFWSHPRHAFLLDLGVAAYHLTASESSAPRGFHYSRDGQALMGGAAIGYGFRNETGFRLGFTLGAQGISGSFNKSQFKRGSLTSASAANLRAALSDSTESLFSASPYLELSMGWMYLPRSGGTQST